MPPVYSEDTPKTIPADRALHPPAAPTAPDPSPDACNPDAPAEPSCSTPIQKTAAHGARNATCAAAKSPPHTAHTTAYFCSCSAPFSNLRCASTTHAGGFPSTFCNRLEVTDDRLRLSAIPIADNCARTLHGNRTEINAVSRMNTL